MDPPLPVRRLEPYLEVYGNSYKRLYFLALRFKRAIFTYQSNALDSMPIQPPRHSILVLRGKYPPLLPHPPSDPFLLFTENSTVRGIPVANPSVETLLRALFPVHSILLSHFRADVLFLVASENPLSAITQKCRKDAAFHALRALANVRLKRAALTLTDVASFRYFKRYDGHLQRFNRWSWLAFDLGTHACINTTSSCPSANLGREVFAILKRSEAVPPAGSLPPPHFYQCELLLSDTEPVGVAYKRAEPIQKPLEYVSPMVVSRPRRSFRDSGSVICDAWLPLYQNQAAWHRFGLEHYVRGLLSLRKQLLLVVAWLHDQTCEKYRLILMDLQQVARILLG